MRAFVFLYRLALIVGLFAVTAMSAPAQEMPTWAAPQELPERTAQASEAPEPCPNANPNDCIGNGGDIPAAPVDGGLALLALLGAGYAVRRLRRDSDDD